MSRVVYYCAATLDGFIADADDQIEWLMTYDGHYEGNGAPPVEGGYLDFATEVGALVSGSVTYEWVLGHLERGGEWPYAGTPWWVLSSRELPVPEGEGIQVRVVDAAVRDIHPELLAAAGDRHLWVLGGGNVASQYADEDLLDEVRVTVVPVVLGDGKPLFDRGLAGGPMQLTGVYPRPSGMVELCYEVSRRGRSAT
jgi:dihydrofolate reductase